MRLANHRLSSRILGVLLLGFSGIHCSTPERTEVVVTPPPIYARAPEGALRPPSVQAPPKVETAAPQGARPEETSAPEAQPSEEAAAQVAASNVDPMQTLYGGRHKFGVNRVSDMARVGTATFSRRGGVIKLEGRVARGQHWLELSGDVTPKGSKEFVLTGVIQGMPDMAWAGEIPRERRTEGRFTFEVKHGRPYWRLYQVNGRPCVCDDGCGNDFCYVDIELAQFQL